MKINVSSETIAVLIFIVLLLQSCGLTKEKEVGSGPYAPEWESLAGHNEEPDWFRDAKLGIYFHWGVYTVPAYGHEWYPRWMHFEGHDYYKHHVSEYGHPSEFGYHDFVPMFKAENFNPEEWADLFLKAGAKFAGPVAEHHDGFSMWDSEVTPWNAMDMGPRRDVTGELRKSITARGMKFITTFHHARNLQRYKGREEEQMAIEGDMRAQFRDSHYPLFPGMPPAMDDEERNYLYGNIPEERWLREIWFGKLREVVDNYQPDIVWFDSWLDRIPDSLRRQFCAYYLNRAHEWGKEVVIVRKQDDLPLECSVDDLEKSRKNRMGEKVWMTDETISKGSWSYTEDLQIKAAVDVLHVLIDIVSKNGVLLLNISPRADGTIPEDQKKVLLEMGDWLSKYGEAIYGTRPWHTFGEGPTREPEGHFRNREGFLNLRYTAEDIRYTAKGSTVYAIILGKPAAGTEILLTSFSARVVEDPLNVEKVSLTGSDARVDWVMEDSGLRVILPQADMDEMAVVLKIETLGK